MASLPPHAWSLHCDALAFSAPLLEGACTHPRTPVRARASPPPALSPSTAPRHSDS